MFGISVRSDSRGWFQDGSCCWNTGPWQQPWPFLDCAGASHHQFPVSVYALKEMGMLSQMRSTQYSAILWYRRYHGSIDSGQRFWSNPEGCKTQLRREESK